MFGSLSLVLLLVSPTAPRPDPSDVPAGASGGSQARSLELLEVAEVWSEAPHAAFTDLVAHGDGLVLAFREGRGHVSSDGALRILRSTDGRAFRSVARLTLDGHDLRDADLSHLPDGRLCLIGGAAPRPADGERAPTGTVASFSSDGETWTAPRIVVEPGRWLWRLAWLGERAYGFSYSAGSGAARLDLLGSTDALAWETLARDVHPEVPSNETALAFEPDPDAEGDGAVRMVALVRAQGREDASVGVARAPFTAFTWQSVGTYVGGPNLIRTAGGAWIAAGRVFVEDEPRTAVFFLDPETGETAGTLHLPSGGDNSYPGLAWWQDELLVSYYSSHGAERRSRIYVARVRCTE